MIKAYNNWDKQELENHFRDVWKEIMKYCEDYSVKNKNGLEAQEIFDLFLLEIQEREDRIEKLMQSIEFIDNRYNSVIDNLKNIINNIG